MFRGLSRRIFGVLLGVSLLSTVCTGWAAYAFASRLIYEEFSTLSSAYYRTSAGNMMLYLNYIEEIAKTTAASPLIESALKQREFITDVPRLLDVMTVTSDLNIRGVTLYSSLSEGYAYSVNSYSVLPSLQQLRENADIDRFLRNPAQDGQWLYRNEHMLGYYGNLYLRHGIFSYLLKVPAEAPSALMIVDLDAGKLANFFVTSNRLLERTGIYLVQPNTGTVSLGETEDADKLSPEDKETMLRTADGQFAASGGERLIVHGNIPDSTAKIALAVPLGTPTGSLAHLRLMIALVSLLVGLLSTVLFWKLRNTIVQPLAALFLKMRKFSSSV